MPQLQCYDNYLVLKYLHENAILPKAIIMGSKFMSIETDVCNMLFISMISKSDGIFTGYVNTFLQIKESSGRTEWCIQKKRKKKNCTMQITMTEKEYT